ncbi:21858_t:CDS:2, partial [Entrophospora sp. SA101]
MSAPMPAQTPISPPVDQTIYKKLEKAILTLNNEINKMRTEAEWRSEARIGDKIEAWVEREGKKKDNSITISSSSINNFSNSN